MSNAFNIKRTETNGDGVALYSVAHPRPTSKIDVIIDALSVAQNSVWSALNQEALAYAVELKTELAKPDLSIKAKERLLRIMGTFDLATGHADNWGSLLDSLESELRDVLNHYREALKLKDNVSYSGNGTAVVQSKTKPTGFFFQMPPRKEWVGLTDEEIKEVLGLNEAPWSLSGVALQHVMDDARALEAKLKEKNGG